LGFQLIRKIHQSPDLFCPLDNLIGNMSDIKPKQRLVYRKCGAVGFRLEADIDISARGGEYQLGENSLYKEDSALKKRLDVGFLGFDRYVYRMPSSGKNCVANTQQQVPLGSRDYDPGEAVLQQRLHPSHRTGASLICQSRGRRHGLSLPIRWSQ
jgi:hypothetical protein